MTFPRIVSEFNGVTGIAIGHGYPSIKTEGAEFKPLCTIVVQVRTVDAQRALQQLRNEAADADADAA